MSDRVIFADFRAFLFGMVYSMFFVESVLNRLKIAFLHIDRMAIRSGAGRVYALKWQAEASRKLIRVSVSVMRGVMRGVIYRDFWRDAARDLSRDLP